MAKSIQRLRAIELRKQGKRITDISEIVGISKSTVSRWCKEVILTSDQVEILELSSRKVRYRTILEIAQRKHLKRQGEISVLNEEGASLLEGKLTKREFIVLGAALYWGEGIKSGRAGLINSNPKIIRIFILWLYEVFSIDKKQLSITLRINAQHQYRAEIIKKFWSKELGIPLTQFANTLFLHTTFKKKYESDDTYFGTVTVRVKNGGDFLHKILGLISGISDAIRYNL